jgi:hypothetical protein
MCAGSRGQTFRLRARLRLAFPSPLSRKSPVQRRDQVIQVPLLGFESANLGPQPSHRPKPDNLLALQAGSQPHAGSDEVADDLHALIGKNTPEVRRLRSVSGASYADRPLPNTHCGNLTVPLGGCHPSHRIFTGWPSCPRSKLSKTSV